jgi:hypothetical protein
MKSAKIFLTLFLCVLTAVPSGIAQQSTTPASQSKSTSEQPKPNVLPVKRTPDGKLILEDGIPVRLRLTRTLSSADAKTGDRVDFEVLDAVKLGDTVVIPQGSIAWATVTDAEHKKRMGRGGKLDVNIDSVKLANGEKANLKASKDTRGGGHVGAMTGAMVATGIVFFPAAPLFLFMHGKDIVIPKGTEVTAYINGDTIYEAPVAAAVAPQSASPGNTEIAISSTPDNADIEIDGAFSGNTPSTVNVASGDHTVTVKKKGFQPWERKIKATGGHINVKAELEASPASEAASTPAAAPTGPKQDGIQVQVH